MSHPAYSHPAVRVASNLWDDRGDDRRLRDLDPHEEEFLAAVHDGRKIADADICEAVLTDALDTYRAFDPDAEEASIELGAAA
jgi:hypothetical protein